MAKTTKQKQDPKMLATQFTVTGCTFMVIGIAAITTSMDSVVNRVIGIIVLAAAAVFLGMSIGLQRKQK